MSFDGSKGPPNIEGMTSLKVDNLTYRTGIDDLKKVFGKYGDVGDIYIPRDRKHLQSRGFAFIRFWEKRDAEDAMDLLDKSILDGREIRVQMARYGRPTETYKPKQRGYNSYNNSSGSGRYRSRSRSPARRRSGGRRYSRSRSKSPRRRHSRSRSPRRNRSRSFSPRRSRSPPAKRQSRSRSRSPANHRSRSRSPPPRRSRSDSPKRSPSRSPREQEHNENNGEYVDAQNDE